MEAKPLPGIKDTKQTTPSSLFPKKNNTQRCFTMIQKYVLGFRIYAKAIQEATDHIPRNSNNKKLLWQTTVPMIIHTQFRNQIQFLNRRDFWNKPGEKGGKFYREYNGLVVLRSSSWYCDFPSTPSPAKNYLMKRLGYVANIIRVFEVFITVFISLSLFFRKKTF